MKSAKTRNVQTNKANYMSEEAFADLKEAMEDALDFERGKHRKHRMHINAVDKINDRWCVINLGIKWKRKSICIRMGNSTGANSSRFGKSIARTSCSNS